MLARSITRCLNRSLAGRLLLPISLVVLVSERAGAQSCYQFSNAHGGTPATVIATFPLTTIPASIVRPGQGDVDYTAAFSSAPGLQNTQMSYSATHIATIIEPRAPLVFFFAFACLSFAAARLAFRARATRCSAVIV